MQIDWDKDAQAHLDSLVDHMLDDKLGPMMVAAVVKDCPKDTGALASTVDHEVDRDKHVLYVTAIGDIDRPEESRRAYAAWVDLGHRMFFWGRDSGRVKQPNPFMRKNLYRKYPGF